MRNLVPLVSSKLSTSAESPYPLKKVHVDQDTVFCCFQDSEIIGVHLWTPATQFNECIEFESDESEIVCVLGNSFSQTCLVLVKSGTVYSVDLAENGASVLFESFTEVVCASWSPDNEILAVLYTDSRLCLYTHTLDLVSEHTLSSEDLKLADMHVSVGWGKRETQFQGKGMKRDPTVQYKPETGELSLHEDEKTAVISWRGDSEFFSLNNFTNSRRSLFMFTRDGVLSSVSEPTDNLLPLVAWQPSGMLIATCRDGEHNCIQFYERNGLKRAAIKLNETRNAAEVVNLSWNANSTIMAVEFKDCIDLYVQKNWHWYKKQSLPVPSEDYGVYWHPEKPFTLLVYSGSQIEFKTYELSTQSTLDGLVAVIDGNVIKATPLKYANVPPPMAFAERAVDEQVSAVCCFQDKFVAASTADKVFVFEIEYTEEELVSVAELDVKSTRFLSFNESGSLNAVLEDNSVCVIEGAEIVRNSTLDQQVTFLRGDYYLSGSTVYNLNTGIEVADFKQLCKDFYVVNDSSAFGLGRNNQLYFNSTSIATNVTSMIKTDSYLIFTTQTKMKFIHLNSSSEMPEVPEVPNDTEISELSREVERGSLLVAVIPEKMAIVLQAPRGNLETLHPQLLVLNYIRQKVAEMDYKTAFRLCKTHRIDMNLMYDLSPANFEANLDSIVKQLQSDTNVDLFLSSLTDENVVETKYIDTTVSNPNGSKHIENKANNLLTKLYDHLSLSCKVTSLALQKPPMLAKALEVASASPELIKHLLFLCDPVQMYRVALGVYKPRLAMRVAEQAQMDPKEYLPFLRARDLEPEFLAKYNIDVYLKNYSDAIVHLIKHEESTDDQIVEFAEHHNLHSTALQLLRGSDRPCEHVILEKQAAVFLKSSQYTRAGENFEVLKMIPNAINAYILAGEWQRALSLTTDTDRESVALRLAEASEANRQYSSAAHVYAYFLKDYKHAIECFCQANLFNDALMISRIHELDEFTNSKLRESFGSFQELVSDCQQQVNSQLKRLREVRRKREEDVLGFDANNEEEFNDNLSIAGTETTNASAYTRYTDKSSVGTAATNATRRTLKNQRRQERKKVRGKKGSVYEEDYLISSTVRLVERLETNRADMQLLVSALYRSDMLVYAQQLITEFNKLIQSLQENIDEVFTFDDTVCIRYDDSGHEIRVERPVKPVLPALLE